MFPTRRNTTIYFNKKLFWDNTAILNMLKLVQIIQIQKEMIVDWYFYLQTKENYCYKHKYTDDIVILFWV